MSLLTDFLIGTNTGQANAPEGGMTEVEWYRSMIRNGTINPSANTGPKRPGYIAPPAVTISVPDSANDVGGGGSTPYISIESALQQEVQVLVGQVDLRNWTDQQVMVFLTYAATNAAVWLGGLDPNATKIAALVAQYVQVYKKAITPA